VAAALLIVAACGPPSSRPLTGLLTFEGRQALTSNLCGPLGCDPVCQLVLDTGIDLGFETAQVRAKVSALGTCLRSEWTDVSATMECVPDCGIIALQITPATVQSLWRFDRSPPATRVQRAHIVTTFNGTVHGQPTFPAVGETPEFECDFTERMCKFQ